MSPAPLIIDTALLLALARLAQDAAAVILRLQADGLTPERKADHSPVTAADRAAETLILLGLDRLWPGVPVLAEEATEAGVVFSPAPWAFVVDPLDGTRAFVRGSAEYTVNIGLVHHGAAVAGALAAPATGEVWAGAPGLGAWKWLADTVTAAAGTPIRCRPYPAEGLTALLSERTSGGSVAGLLRRAGVTTSTVMSSSLKFARLAEGAADLYPRVSPTCEWDTAAGQALLEGAGGQVLAPDGGPLSYMKAEADYLNRGGFTAWGGPAL